MSWYWLSLVEEWPDGASAAAWAHENGERVGVLAAWCRRAKPHPAARRVASCVIDPHGAPARISLVLPAAGVRLAFDDPAVQHARRRSLSELPFDTVSTLLTDASHFQGAVTVARGRNVSRLPDDPFARVFPARLLDVDGGLFGSAPPPPGPRYGSAEPWPWDRFPVP